MKKKILFVCTLNIGRSAMAEVITNEVYGDVAVASSAGMYASGGVPMCYDAKAALLRAGYGEESVRYKTSNVLTEDMIADSDIVVGVTDDHVAALCRKYPAYKQKVVGFHLDVHASSSGDEKGYDLCFENLCEGIEKILYPEGGKWGSQSKK